MTCLEILDQVTRPFLLALRHIAATLPYNCVLGYTNILTQFRAGCQVFNEMIVGIDVEI